MELSLNLAPSSGISSPGTQKRMSVSVGGEKMQGRERKREEEVGKGKEKGRD